MNMELGTYPRNIVIHLHHNLYGNFRRHLIKGAKSLKMAASVDFEYRKKHRFYCSREKYRKNKNPGEKVYQDHTRSRNKIYNTHMK